MLIPNKEAIKLMKDNGFEDPKGCAKDLLDLFFNNNDTNKMRQFYVRETKVNSTWGLNPTVFSFKQFKDLVSELIKAQSLDTKKIDLSNVRQPKRKITPKKKIGVKKITSTTLNENKYEIEKLNNTLLNIEIALKQMCRILEKKLP